VQVKAGILSVSLLVEANDKGKGLDEEHVELSSSQQRHGSVHFDNGDSTEANNVEVGKAPPRDSFEEMKNEDPTVASKLTSEVADQPSRK
jgi:hypothetical protein